MDTVNSQASGSRKITALAYAVLSTGIAILAFYAITTARRISLNRDLVKAASVGDIPEVERFLMAGADPNTKPECLECEKMGTLARLLSLGAHRKHQTFDERDTVLWLALNPELYEAHGHGALDPNPNQTNSRRAETAAMLIRYGAKVNFRSSIKTTPLMWAAEKGQPQLIRSLVAAGARLNERDGAGSTALLEAAKWETEVCVEELIKAGADPKIVDNEGRSPHWWAKNRSNDRIAALLNRAEQGQQK